MYKSLTPFVVSVYAVAMTIECVECSINSTSSILSLQSLQAVVSMLISDDGSNSDTASTISHGETHEMSSVYTESTSNTSEFDQQLIVKANNRSRSLDSLYKLLHDLPQTVRANFNISDVSNHSNGSHTILSVSSRFSNRTTIRRGDPHPFSWDELWKVLLIVCIFLIGPAVTAIVIHRLQS